MHSPCHQGQGRVASVRRAMSLSGFAWLTANIFSGKSGIRIVFRKAFLPLQALKSYLQPPVVPGESQSVNQVLA